jgi:hypothetical protein
MSQRKSIRISHAVDLKPKSIQTKAKFDQKNGVYSQFVEETDAPALSSIICELPDGSSFNQLELIPFSGLEDFFPDTFRFEVSPDGEIWEPILQENGFKRSNKIKPLWNFSLLETKFIKFVGKISKRTDQNKCKIALGGIQFRISGITSIQASSERERLTPKENLIDTRKDYGWASAIKSEPGEEYLVFDLGSINRVEEVRLLSKNAFPTHFPESFTFYHSEDDLTWHKLWEEPSFLSEPGMWYRWRFLPVNLRFLKMIIKDQQAPSRTEFTSEVIEIEVYASVDFLDKARPKDPEPIPYSTILRSGLVRLASDGESREGVAVQGSDRRLRDATTNYKGIVELASDGEDKLGVVVQGNDKRLKNATDTTYGLTRLARSGENRSGVVVQGDDERLRPATIDAPGIIELAEDGETRPGVVVQGNDSRLKKATRKEYGLVILGESGDTSPEKVITGDDPRLKEGNTELKGIVRFARNGEESELAAVQGNDKRLKLATTELFGIVQLAESGEDKEGVVIQGNDKRLKKATEETLGIVTLSKKGMNTPGYVVQADDPRLSDQRDPKPHTHEYAPLEHDINSHTGLLRMKGSSQSEFKGIVPPPQNHSIIYGKNDDANGSAIVGVGGKEGIIGYGESYGISGYAGGSGQHNAGVLGLGNRANGGYFASSGAYAIVANGDGLDDKAIHGSGKAIHAIGGSLFEGVIQIQSQGKGECIAKVFQLDMKDAVIAGDLLVATEENGKLSRSKHPYATNIVGVCVESAGFLLGDEKKETTQILVAIMGIAYMNVDTSQGNINPGDLLVSGLTSGHASKADPAKLKPGMVVAKALESTKKAKGLIQVLLLHL